MINKKYLIVSVIAVLTAITLFSCEGNYQKVQQLNLTDETPLGEGKGINLKYTDSGRVTANLIAARWLDYTNFNFSYSEFPDGLEVHFWNDEGKESVVTADYGIQYDQTNIVDLRGNVLLITSDSLVLQASQLYWDQKNKWVFTDQPYKIEFEDGSYNDGACFDSNQEFTIFLSRKNSGVQILDKIKEENGE